MLPVCVSNIILTLLINRCWLLFLPQISILLLPLPFSAPQTAFLMKRGIPSQHKLYNISFQLGNRYDTFVISCTENESKAQSFKIDIVPEAL